MSSYFAHPNALIDNGAVIGERTRVWAFAHVLGDTVIGEDCNICDHTFIEGGVRLGNRVTVKCGVSLWHGLRAEDDVFIGPHCAFSNDLRPRSRRYPAEFLKTLLKQGCSLGANSTVLAGLTVGRWAMVGAGAVVTHNVPDFALVTGAPARFRAWICMCGEKLTRGSDVRLTCSCTKRYEQVAEHEVREISVGGS
jgi:UDP-2-acetamido-3-amino-2,3-dideoxy-glucuronate N-acetyltransferase